MLSQEDSALLRALANGKRAASNISITNCIPTLAQPDPFACFNIIRTTFETDRIPTDWLPCLERFDEIWVISRYNQWAFRRSGIPPEKLRIVPSCLDTSLYCPEGDKFPLHRELDGRFVFLSSFDWQFRKGWDLLLSAYCEAFTPEAGAGLVLKISRLHGQSPEHIHDQAEQVLSQLSQSLEQRHDIHLIDAILDAPDMAALYRSADAFVLPSRGEGWGRPYMEAMASGLPVIGTGASGNIDFMNDSNSFLVPASTCPIPPQACAEIPVYSGHCWFEPDYPTLIKALQTVASDAKLRDKRARRAREDMVEHFSIAAGAKRLSAEVDRVHARFETHQLPAETSAAIRLRWEGELFAGHSFSNINETLSRMFAKDDRFALSIDRKYYNPVHDHETADAHELTPFIARSLTGDVQVTVRHTFPPNWNPPDKGKWIHIQPWEYGHLPVDWLKLLQKRVDEIWAPSSYVKRVYERSGIPSEKIHVIPWGIDPTVFNTEVPGLLLPTEKTFRLLFVGGTLARKGFDRLLQAYLEEFSRQDDVCLVVKDVGTDSFYRHGNLRQQVLSALA